MALRPTAAKSTPASRARRQVLTDLRRSEIIAAALKVFSRKGFHAARAEDVAAQAKIAKGTLYLYFDSKDAIYHAAAQHACDELAALSRDVVAAADGPQGRVEAWVRTRLQFWAARGDLYHMILTVGRETRHRRQTSALLRSSHAEITSILRDAIATGQLPQRDLDPIGWLVMDAIRGSNERRILQLCERSVDKETVLITGAVMRYFQQP